jgi:hypothetical protein
LSFLLLSLFFGSISIVFYLPLRASRQLVNSAKSNTQSILPPFSSACTIALLFALYCSLDLTFFCFRSTSIWAISSYICFGCQIYLVKRFFTLNRLYYPLGFPHQTDPTRIEGFDIMPSLTFSLSLSLSLSLIFLSDIIY